ncbi:CDAN1-interacting nuclease 1-like [Tubulanus polymorphus]|uniref:CDAN1-interacting nuclease 1-like n=1 Tax=Tubulanus polymorphus TaxID=672921 RepID=UPI003DA227B4
MHLGLYREIVDFIKSHKCRPNFDTVVQKFKDIPKDTLGSICSLEYQKKSRRVFHKHNSLEVMEDYYQRYLDKRNDGNDVLIKLADEVDLSPMPFARIVLERHLHHLNFESEMSNNPRTVISKMLKDTTTIPDPVLAYQIDMCILNDEYCGPVADCIKHSIGEQYEVILKKAVEKHNLSYQDEHQMRLKGYDKTPDIKLEVPIAVDGHVVNWIESKASFGDEYSHQGYLKDQFWSYWNRFGPGMVIYWFGFIDELDSNRDKGILLKDNFPESITKMNPSQLEVT